MSFSEKLVLITGAGAGIGLATAKAFAAAGASLAMVDLNETALREAAEQVGGDPLTIAADVTDEAQVRDFVERAAARTGRIDAFINNAGINGDFANIPDQSVLNWRAVLEVNVIGAFLGLKHVLPVMYAQGSGAVVNMASNGGLLGAPGMSAYVASKHAVIGLNKSAALEAAPHGVRVNAICPSGVDTQMMRRIEHNAMAGHEAEARAAFEAAVPLKRYAEATEIADLAVFLASGKASFVTGAYYRIDGGGGAMSA